MAMKLTVNIDKYPYKIELVPIQSIMLGNGEYYGRVDYEDNKIYIANTLKGIRLKEVLIHELTHAHLNRNKHQFKKYSEEDVCHMFELYAEKVVKIVNEVMKKLEERKIENESRNK